MTIRQLKLLCWTATGLLFAGALTAIIAGIAMPVEVSAIESDGETTVRSRSTAPVADKLSMADFEPYMSGTLRAAPQVAAPVAPVAEAPPPPVQVSEMELKGTVIDEHERDRSVAIIKAGESIEFKKLGEKINDAEVTEITDGVAVLKRNGESLTLRVPLPPG